MFLLQQPSTQRGNAASRGVDVSPLHRAPKGKASCDKCALCLSAVCDSVISSPLRISTRSARDALCAQSYEGLCLGKASRKPKCVDETILILLILLPRTTELKHLTCLCQAVPFNLPSCYGEEGELRHREGGSHTGGGELPAGAGGVLLMQL